MDHYFCVGGGGMLEIYRKHPSFPSPDVALKLASTPAIITEKEDSEMEKARSSSPSCVTQGSYRVIDHLVRLDLRDPVQLEFPSQ